MADINALIAAGPHTRGLDVAGNMMKVQQIKDMQRRNQLAYLQEERLQRTDKREQKRFETVDQLRQGLVLQRYLNNDDIDGAISLVTKDGLTDQNRPVLEVLQSGDPEKIGALKSSVNNLINDAIAVGDIEQPTEKQRRIVKGADNYNYYADTGERVLPDVQAPPSEAAKPTAKQEEIQAYLKQFPDLSEPEATAIAYGKARVDTDQLGVVRFINDLAQESNRVLNDQVPEMAPVSQVSGQSLYEATREGTGLWNMMAVGAGGIVSKFNEGSAEFAAEERKAKRRLQLASRGMIRAFSLSPRYPVAEQNAIKEELDLMPSIMNEPNEMRDSMIVTDGYIARAIAQAELDARSTNDPDVKKDAMRIARDMRAFYSQLGVPLEDKEDLVAWAQSSVGFYDKPIEEQQEIIDYYRELQANRE